MSGLSLRDEAFLYSLGPFALEPVERRARRQPFRIADHLDRECADQVAARDRLRDRLAPSSALTTPTAKPSPAPTVSTTLSTRSPATVPSSPSAVR